MQTKEMKSIQILQNKGHYLAYNKTEIYNLGDLKEIVLDYEIIFKIYLLETSLLLKKNNKNDFCTFVLYS